MVNNDIAQAWEQYNSYDAERWIHAYFDADSGGYCVYHRRHQFTSTGGGGHAEQVVGIMLAALGKQVEFLPEGSVKSPDIRFDEQTWDIKYIPNANENTIIKHIKDARKADNAIFYWDNNKDKVPVLKNSIARCAGYFKAKNEYKIMPDVYYIDNGKLKLLWAKK